MSLKKLTKFNWRSLGKFTNPAAISDLNSFLEKLPRNTSQSVLIIACVIWGVAGVLGVYTTVKMQALDALSIAHDEAEALLPVVPKIQDKPVSPQDVRAFVGELKKIYNGLEIKGSSSNIILRAKSTAQFGEFREAIGHVQNGGLGWRVNVERLCVGRECKQYPLSASLKINKVSVEK